MNHFASIAIGLLVAAVVIGRYLRRLRTHPLAPCLFCKDRGGRNAGSQRKSFGKCAWCKGSRERLKFGSWVVYRRNYSRGGRLRGAS